MLLQGARQSAESSKGVRRKLGRPNSSQPKTHATLNVRNEGRDRLSHLADSFSISVQYTRPGLRKLT